MIRKIEKNKKREREREDFKLLLLALLNLILHFVAAKLKLQLYTFVFLIYVFFVFSLQIWNDNTTEIKRTYSSSVCLWFISRWMNRSIYRSIDWLFYYISTIYIHTILLYLLLVVLFVSFHSTSKSFIR